MQLILASSSPRRQDLLQEAGYCFESEAPYIDEWDSTTHPDLSAIDLALANAQRKAQKVAEHRQDAVVLAADTIVYCDGKVLGKPEDQGEAKKMLRLLNGKTHEVITAMAWFETAKNFMRRCVDKTYVTFRNLSEEDIDFYLGKVHVLDKAGGYAVQEHGEEIIERIEGSRTNVIGLPMERLQEWWDDLGV
ncbi:MAG: nucleoside triphosphate pyrophosphatase [Verrucomicrobiota bacterium]